MKFRPFAEAREFVQSLGLKNEHEWRGYSKSTAKPPDIPATPQRVYEHEWKGMGDWLGTGRVASQKVKFLPFERAKEFVHSLGLNRVQEWSKYCVSGQKPEYIPSNPHKVYRKNWISWPDWLGTERLSFLPFQKAREYVHSLGLKSEKEWRAWCKSGKKPDDIPYNASTKYKNEWKGMGDWLGTGRIANQNKEYWLYPKAKEFVHSLGLRNVEQWLKYCASGQKPEYIPSNPNLVYKNEWEGMGDWLGSGTIATRRRTYKPFEEARRYAHSLGLRSWEEWTKWAKSDNKPKDIPTNPNKSLRTRMDKLAGLAWYK